MSNINNKSQKKRKHEDSEDVSYNLKETTSKKHTSEKPAKPAVAEFEKPADGVEEERDSDFEDMEFEDEGFDEMGTCFLSLSRTEYSIIIVSFNLSFLR